MRRAVASCSRARSSGLSRKEERAAAPASIAAMGARVGATSLPTGSATALPLPINHAPHGSATALSLPINHAPSRCQKVALGGSAAAAASAMILIESARRSVAFSLTISATATSTSDCAAVSSAEEGKTSPPLPPSPLGGTENATPRGKDIVDTGRDAEGMGSAER